MDREAATRQIETQREYLQADSRLKGKHIAALKRRHDYLDDRINASPNDTAMGFLMSERAALRWALDLMEAHR